MTFVMITHTMRQRIISYLEQHKGSSAQEISNALRVTSADIRHHLSYLVKSDQIQAAGFRNDNKKGRPACVYDLSEHVIGDNIAGLCSNLLELLTDEKDHSISDETIKKLAILVTPKLNQVQAKKITNKLAALVLALNNLGYQSKWEARISAPRIIFEHCPYKKIINSHPELCIMDKLMLQNALQVEVDQIARLEKNLRATEFCMFEVSIN